MGWGVEFKTDVFLNKETYGTQIELEDAIKETEDDQQKMISRVMMIVSANPRDIVPEEWKDQPIDFLHTEIDNLMDEILETERLLVKRYMYLEYVKENGIVQQDD